jgi:hypothetical protein
MSKPKTRSSSTHSVFGNPLEEIPNTELPTKLQVGQHVMYLKDSKFSNNKDLIPHLAQVLIDLWYRASIPPQSLKAVKTKLHRFLQDGSDASKHGKQVDKTKKFENSLHQLFDITACQCQSLNECNCAKEVKVPAREHAFLIDQRTVRRMQISTVDKPTTSEMNRRLARETRMKERADNEKRRKLESNDKVRLTTMGEMESFPTSEGTDSDTEQEEEWTLPESSMDARNMIQIPTVALEAERFGVSNRAVAAIGTAALLDYGVVCQEDRSNIIDHKKVWRARQQLRKELRTTRSNDEDIIGLFFDGRKDSTLVKEKSGGKWYSLKKTEDHYVLVGEPGTIYLHHITLVKATGVTLADGLHKAIDNLGLLQKILAVGADSTAVNTGARGGAIHLLECHLHRPVQWIICWLHLNELPLRHLCKELIGPTEGPGQWKGPIGCALVTCETLPKTIFNIINDGNMFPDIDTDNYNLSRDQAYLYKIIKAIRTGVISDDLLRQKPGPMSMARWLTTASRICRLYVGTSQPSSQLILLTHFIVTNYGPMWFSIKCSHKCTDGARHLLNQIEAQRLLSPAVKKITWPVIQRNAYWAHEENVLLAMLSNEGQDIRKLAINRIKEIRQAPRSSQHQIREFRPPAVKDTAVTLQDLLSAEESVFEPPLSSQLSDEELDQIMELPYSSSIPCHSQGVERCVKLVTEASGAVYGFESRDGYIRAVVKSRDFMPSFESKQDFCAVADN